MRSILTTLAGGLFSVAPLGLMFAASEAKADQLTPLYLTKGQDYALVADGDCEGGVKLINPAGVVTINLEACFEPELGQEFRAAYTGTYQVQVTDGPNWPTDFWLDKDCRKDAKTLCTFRPRTTKTGLFSWANDDDWFRLSLVRGRTYAFTYHRGTSWDSTYGVDAFLTLRNAAGNELAATDQIAEGTLTFRAKATGTYYLDVYNADWDFGGSYLLRMTGQ